MTEIGAAHDRDDRLAVLWAEREIRRLAISYAHAILVRDADLMLALWEATETPAEFPDLDIHWARELVARWDAPGTSLLHVTNHLIELRREDHAHGRVYCVAQLDRPSGFIDQSIVYEDEYVRHEGSWLFATRRHVTWFGATRPQSPLDQPPMNWPRSQVGSGDLEALRPFAVASPEPGRPSGPPSEGT